MDIKAIETVYNGYKFRSRLEARWAVFFDTLGVEYQYESEGFDLNGTWYLPDFWLPSVECWVEIKPKCASSIEKDTARRLSEFTQKPVLIIYGNFSSSQCFFQADIFPALLVSKGEFVLWALITRLVLYQAHVGIANLLNKKPWDAKSGYYFSVKDEYERAFQAARQARFEHGQTGA